MFITQCHGYLLPNNVKITSAVCLICYFCNFVTPWTAALQAPLSKGFSRQEYWSGLPLPSPTSATNSTKIMPVQIVCLSKLYQLALQIRIRFMCSFYIMIYLLFFKLKKNILAMLHGMWGPSSLTREQTHDAPFSKNVPS